MHWINATLCLIALPALWWGFHAKQPGRHRSVVVFLLILIGISAWFRFDPLHSSGSPVHPHELYHYAVNAKYYQELGYFEIYRCTAKALRELGDGAELRRYRIRDLDNNKLKRGNWAETTAGSCRAEFSPDRWQTFKRDISIFRNQFGLKLLARAVADHGYNATPVNNAFLSLWVTDIQFDTAHLARIILLDSVFVILILLFIYKGFGIQCCTIAALFIGLGAPWSYEWIGGGFGRMTWVVFLTAGMAFLHKKWYFLAGATLALSSLFRLFPIAFLAAAALYFLIVSIQNKRLSPALVPFIAGAIITLVAGISWAGWMYGFDSFPAFYQVMLRHTGTPLANHMGLPALLGWEPGQSVANLIDQRLDDPFETWKTTFVAMQASRNWIWVTGMALSVGLMVAILMRRVPTIWSLPLVGYFLLTAISMTNYDTIWMIVFAPLIAGNLFRTACLFIWLLSMQLIAQFDPGFQEQFLLYTVSALTFVIAIAFNVLSQTKKEPLNRDQNFSSNNASSHNIN